MKQTVTFGVFQQGFEALRPGNFSYEGLTLLFDYLEQYEQDTGEEMELDVIALCCEWAEMEYEEIAFAYDLNLKIEDYEEMDECEKQKAVEQWLQDWTMVAGATSDGSLIFCQSF